MTKKGSVDSVNYYTSYLEINEGSSVNEWQYYQPGTAVAAEKNGSLEARVNVQDLEKVGLIQPADLTLRAQEIIVEEPGIPIIDVNYRQLNIHNARAGENSSESPKVTMNNVANQQGVYYYDNLLTHEGNILGAKVTWEASAGVKKLRFDDWSGNKGEKERFQPIIASKNNNQEGGTVGFFWEFFYVGDNNKVDNGDQRVALGRFWMNPIDLDGTSNKWEFFDVFSEENVNEITLAANSKLRTTRDKNAVTPNNLNDGWTRISGAQEGCDLLCDDNPKKEEFAAAINYFQPKSTLDFSYGVHGSNYGGDGETHRLFSVSLGDAIITEGLEPPELVPLEDEATIRIDCKFRIGRVLVEKRFVLMTARRTQDLRSMWR